MSPLNEKQRHTAEHRVVCAATFLSQRSKGKKPTAVVDGCYCCRYSAVAVASGLYLTTIQQYGLTLRFGLAATLLRSRAASYIRTKCANHYSFWHTAAEWITMRLRKRCSCSAPRSPPKHTAASVAGWAQQQQEEQRSCSLSNLQFHLSSNRDMPGTACMDAESWRSRTPDTCWCHFQASCSVYDAVREAWT